MPDRLVYSTDGGRVNTCPVCGQAYKYCRCDQPPTQQVASTQKSDGIVRIMRDRKHRGGKTVPVRTCGPATNEDIATLAQQLNKLCGSGGTRERSRSGTPGRP